jgi:hypothetical protein
VLNARPLVYRNFIGNEGEFFEVFKMTKEDSLNSKYPFPEDMLINIGAIPNNKEFPRIRSNQRFVLPEFSYQCSDEIYRPVYFTDENGYEEIIIPHKNEVLTRPKSSDIYTSIIGDGDPNAINDWENNPILNQDPKINIAQFPENDEPHLKELSLLSCIEQDSFTAKLTQNLSDVCNIPSSTALLVTEACFASMTSMVYECHDYHDDEDEDNKAVCISECVLAEQSDCKNNSTLQNVTVDLMKKIVRKNIDLKYKEKRKDEAESLTSSTRSELEEANLNLKFNEHVNSLFYLKPITNDATPQEFKRVLKHTKGVVTVISTKPALINTLFFSSGKYSLLAEREGRSNGYNGHCSATICCFAQKNVMQKAIEAADASGVLEQFKVIAEPNRVGMRNGSEDVQLDKNLLKIYKQKCSFFKKVFINGFDPDNRITLYIEHWDSLNIRHFENEFESQLKDGGKYANPIMRKYEGKIKTHVLSLACNLFLLEEEAPDKSCYVPSKYVLSAIQMMKQLTDGLHTYCVGRSIISNNEQIKFIFDLVVKHSNGLKMREIKQQCEGVHPFKDLPSDSKRIQEVVRFLASNNVLLRSCYGSYIKNPKIDLDTLI